MELVYPSSSIDIVFSLDAPKHGSQLRTLHVNYLYLLKVCRISWSFLCFSLILHILLTIFRLESLHHHVRTHLLEAHLGAMASRDLHHTQLEKDSVLLHN